MIVTDHFWFKTKSRRRYHFFLSLLSPLAAANQIELALFSLLPHCRHYLLYVWRDWAAGWLAAALPQNMHEHPGMNIRGSSSHSSTECCLKPQSKTPQQQFTAKTKEIVFSNARNTNHHPKVVFIWHLYFLFYVILCYFGSLISPWKNADHTCQLVAGYFF